MDVLITLAPITNEINKKYDFLEDWESYSLKSDATFVLLSHFAEWQPDYTARKLGSPGLTHLHGEK
jgi:hypothetical protein